MAVKQWFLSCYIVNYNLQIKLSQHLCNDSLSGYMKEMFLCDLFVGGLLQTVFPRFFIHVHFIDAFILALSPVHISANLVLVYIGLIPGLVGLCEAKCL